MARMIVSGVMRRRVQFALTRSHSLPYNRAMTVQLRPDQESQLERLASRTGRAADEIAQEAVDRFLDHDAWFSEQVAQGIASLDRGDALTHEDVGSRIERLFHG